MNDNEYRLHELFVRSLAGDRRAYRLVLEALGRHLRAFFRRRLSRLPDEVEDLVQETLLAIHTRRHTYDPCQPLTAWVHAIARYKMIDMLRRRRLRDELSIPLEDDDLLAGSEDDALQPGADLASLLEQLPDRQRLPILHVKLGGLTVAETAIRMGMSESAVKVGVHRGIKMLAAKMRAAK